jgi:hypothetical protein
MTKSHEICSGIRRGLAEDSRTTDQVTLGQVGGYRVKVMTDWFLVKVNHPCNSRVKVDPLSGSAFISQKGAGFPSLLFWMESSHLGKCRVMESHHSAFLISDSFLSLSHIE